MYFTLKFYQRPRIFCRMYLTAFQNSHTILPFWKTSFIYIYRYHIKRILSSRVMINKNKAISLSHIQTYLIKNSTKLIFFLIFTASERDTRTTFASYSCQVDSSVLTKHQHIYPDQTNEIHWKGKNQ